MSLYYFLGKKHKEKYEQWRDVLNPRNDYHKEGIDYIKLEKELKEIGFSRVILIPRFSVKPEYKTKLFYKIITTILPIIKSKYCYSHIKILAIKWI